MHGNDILLAKSYDETNALSIPSYQIWSSHTSHSDLTTVLMLSHYAAIASSYSDLCHAPILFLLLSRCLLIGI